MKVPAFLVAVQKLLSDAVRKWGPWGRGAWCRKQRRALRTGGRPVLWVRGDAVPWAEWGGRNGYFEVDYMGALPYLRALGAPTA
jgi:hypothetical protein